MLAPPLSEKTGETGEAGGERSFLGFGFTGVHLSF
jgi:hypothetical protein